MGLGSRKGWKTLGFKNNGRAVGTLTVAGILKNSPTLDNLRLSGCIDFSSKVILKLLYTAPELKRFDTIMDAPYEKMVLSQCMLMAKDIVSSDWVCHNLESLKCLIGGATRTNPMIGPTMRAGALEQSVRAEEGRALQRKVMTQLGQLNHLCDVTLGQSTEADDMHEKDNTITVDDSDRVQRQCLTLSLENGLDQQKGLKVDFISKGWSTASGTRSGNG